MEHKSFSLKFTGSGEIKIYYAVNRSKTTAPSIENINAGILGSNGHYGEDVWYETVPNWRGANGTYLWQLTITEFSDYSLEKVTTCLETRQAAELVVQKYQLTNSIIEENKHLYYANIADWCQKTGTTIINGSEIVTGSITTKQLATDSIQSLNFDIEYKETSDTSEQDNKRYYYKSGSSYKTGDSYNECKELSDDEKVYEINGIYSNGGSFFDLKNGNIYTPSFSVSSIKGEEKAYFKGEVTATKLTIGGQDYEEIPNPDLSDYPTKSDLNTSDKVTIYGGNIKAGSIQSEKYVPEEFGLKIDLDNGAFDSPNFKVDAYGGIIARSANITGTSNIGGLTLEDEILRAGNFSLGVRSGKTASIIFSGGNQTTVVNDSGIYTSSFTAGELVLQQTGLSYGNEATKIEMAKTASTGETYTLTLYSKIITMGSVTSTYGAYITSDKEMPSDQNFSIKYQILNKDLKSTSIKIDKGTTQSDTITLGSGLSLSKLYFTDTESSTITYNPPNNPHIGFKGDIAPLAQHTYYCGQSNASWAGGFTQTAFTLTSDKNEKNSILKISNSYSQVFDKLVPVSYKFNENTSDRTHIGFIAQDVEQALLDVGLTTKDFAGICYWDKEDGTKGYGLRYEEFIALNTHEIQKLKKRITEQDQRILELEEKLSNLEKLMLPSES